MASSMTMKHRKLFPTSTTNETVACDDPCDQTCPYGCYPYTDSYFLPPPPPPPLPPSTNKGQLLSPFVIVIVTLLASLFLVVSYYLIILKYCRRSNRFRQRQARSDGQDEDFLDENHGPVIEHPIWYITTVGLQPSLINSITVFKYKKGDSLVEGTDCSVCLNEFRDDETLRLLPKCNHAFHIPCIDTWLRSHTNCPLCRAGIVSNAVTVSTTPLASHNQNSTSLNPNEDTQMDVLESDGELDTNQVTLGEFFENSVRTEDISEFSQVVDEPKDIENPKTETNSNGNNEFSVIPDLGDNNMVIGDENYEIQAMRRFVSMDSLMAASISLSVTRYCGNECQGSSVDPRVDIQKFDMRDRVGRNSRILRMMGGPSFEEFLHKSPVSMKRSFSCNGRSFLLRNCRSSNSILPL